MPQPSRFVQERRRHPRRPAAYAFWVQRSQAQQRSGAWMLNISSGGAAFLTAAEHAPRVGERLKLAEMYSAGRLVREGALPLPPVARVIRMDDSEGATRRVAVRFVSEIDSRLQAHRHRGHFAGASLTQPAKTARLDNILPPLHGDCPASDTILR